MTRKGSPLKRLVLAAMYVQLGWLALPDKAFAAPIYELLPYTWSQLGLTITDEAGPFEVWDTHLRYTNTTGQNLTNVRLWFYAATLNGQPAQWDNTLLQGATASGLTWLGDNPSAHIALGLSNIPIPPGYALDANSTVTTWLLGDIAVGAFADVHARTLMSDAVSQAFFPGFAFTQSAPEPGFLVLLGLGLSTLAARTRRRRSTPRD